MRAATAPTVTLSPYVPWSALPTRPALRWPEGARVAFCVIVSLEHVEWQPPAAALVPPSTVQQKWGPYPWCFDPHEVGHHEYGNRVGIFRVMQALDRFGVRACVAMDTLLAERNSFLVHECLRRRWEFIGHGLAFTRMINELMPEEIEREFLAESIGRLARVAGSTPRGWLGAEYGESARTVKLLAELGVEYVCDWPGDEQPYVMTVPRGRMVSLPVAIELDEVFTHRLRGIQIDAWRRIVCEAFDQLMLDGEHHGRLLVLNVHPYLIGQPFRIRYLEDVLDHILTTPGVWVATGSEIVDWYLAETAHRATELAEREVSDDMEG